MVVLFEHLLDAPAASQQINDELDRNASSFDDRLAHKDLRINRDSIFPCHGGSRMPFGEQPRITAPPNDDSLLRMPDHPAVG